MDKNLSDAYQIILGPGKTGGYYLAGLFFVLIAIIISLLYSSRKRDPASPNTPEKFSFTFLLWDNFKRAALTFLVEFLLFRLFDLSNVWAMIGAGFAGAIALDQIVEALMNSSEFICKLLSRNRESFPQKPQ